MVAVRPVAIILLLQHVPAVVMGVEVLAAIIPHPQHVPAVVMGVEVLAATMPQVHVPTVQSNVLIHVIRPVIQVVNRAVEEVVTMHVIVAIRCVVMVQKAVVLDVVLHVKPTAQQHVLMDVINNQKIHKFWIH